MSTLTAIIHWDGAPVTADIVEQLAAASIGHLTVSLHNNLGFGHLSSCAPTAERQPLLSEEQRFILISDARIDNRQELLRLLPPFGTAPNAVTDNELILAAYRQWGEHSPAHLIGDFAFIIWDNTTQTLFAARDAMNMRTLHYAFIGKNLCVTSEATQLLRHPAISREINPLALMAWMCGKPRPDLAMFQQVETLPVGHHLVATQERLQITPYWKIDPDYTLRYKKIGDYEAHLYAILNRCVTDRMRCDSDVIATQLSGGMDSTSVTALAKGAAPSLGKELFTISHTYSSVASCDETERIHQMLHHLKITDAHFLAAEEHAALDFRALYPPAWENPGTVWSPRYSDEMNLLRSKKATVLLTGSGGDEMTWGHSLTYSRRLLRGDLTSLMEAITGCRQLQLPLLPALYRLFIQPVIPTSAQRTLRRLRGRAETTQLPPWIPAATAKRFDLEAYLAAESIPTFNNSAQQARYEALRHSSTYHSVRSYQQVGAAHGIEVRHPFFDRRFMEFSFAIPDDLWLRHNYPKWLLRRTMTPHLPTTVCWNRNKVIFDSFFAKVIRDQIDSVRVILADKRLEERGLIDTKQVLATLDAIKNSTQPSLTVDFLYVLMAQIWFQKYADNRV